MVGSGPWHRDHTPPTRTHACSTHAQQARPRGRGKRLKWHRFTIFRALRAPSTATAPKKCLPESVFSGRTRKNFFARAGARAVSQSPMCHILHLVLPCGKPPSFPGAILRPGQATRRPISSTRFSKSRRTTRTLGQPATALKVGSRN